MTEAITSSPAATPPTICRETYQITEGRSAVIESGELASMASSQITVRFGDCVLSATCCIADKPREGIDFFPLMIDFEERHYAVGRIPASYNRREGRPIDKAILVSRLIDRPLRPLFPESFRNDVQVAVTMLSSDGEQPPEPYAMLAASLAVCAAGAPVPGPIGAVRVGLINNQMLINPSYEELAASELDLIVAANNDNVLMIEAGANFVSEDVLLAGISFAQEEIRKQIAFQERFLADLKVQPFAHEPPAAPSAEALATKAKVSELAEPALKQIIEAGEADKTKRDREIKAVYELVKAHYEGLAEEDPAREQLPLALKETKALEKQLMRNQILDQGRRVDGRKCDEIRPIWSKTSYLPRAHGSAVFTRGNTQVISVATLGSGIDAKPIDGIWPEKEQRYFHHYNFPPYSVGEVRPMRSPGRREVGHGALAERAILPALPSIEEFPYVLRVVSDVVSSNGSTSMASTCGSCLALMDGGVPLKAVIGGIAMGLIMQDSRCAVLSDIQGVEDFLGDMDFKVTGSREGVTAIQLDLKLPAGIPLKLLKVALEQARHGRIHIIDCMCAELASPRPELSKYAPLISTLKVEQDEIGLVIGPGGKNIKKLIEDSAVQKIDISDEGVVTIVGTLETIRAAENMLKQLTLKVEVGEEYPGVVVRKLEIGTMVELAPGKVGLLRTPGTGGGRGRDRDHRRGGRGGRGRGRDRDEQFEQEPIAAPEEQPVMPEPTPVVPETPAEVYEIGERVLAVVGGIDNKGRINLASLKRLETLTTA